MMTLRQHEISVLQETKGKRSLRRNIRFHLNIETFIELLCFIVTCTRLDSLFNAENQNNSTGWKDEKMHEH